MNTPTEDSPWTAGRRAAGEVAVPASLVLGFAALLVFAYYRVAAVHDAMEVVASIRRKNTLIFAMVSTSLTAGLIPWALRMAVKTIRPAHPWRDLLHSMIWWALMGFIVDQFYTLLTFLFGPAPGADLTPMIVLAKVACDMSFFTVLVGAPFNALSHLWKDLNWDFTAFRAQLGSGWYRRIVVPNLLPNWLVWIPGTAIFYSLPADLQLAVANAIGCMWALMCVRIASHSRPSKPLA